MKTAFLVVIKPTIAIILGTVLLTQILSVVQFQSASNNNGMLQYSLAQSGSDIPGNITQGELTKKVEQVMIDSGMKTSSVFGDRMDLQYGTFYSLSADEPKPPGESGIGIAYVWWTIKEAQDYFKQQVESLQNYSGDVKLQVGENGFVWYDPGNYFANGVNKKQFSPIGTGRGVFVCGTINLGVTQVSVGAPVDPPKESSQLNQFYNNLKEEGTTLSQKARADVQNKLQGIVNTLISGGLCTGTPQPQMCPAGSQLENTPVSSGSTSQNNIKLATYTSGGSASYQNLGIVKVQDTGPKTAPKTTGPFTYDKKPWKLTYEIVDKEGLVITDITAGDQVAFKSLSVPHFKIESSKVGPGSQVSQATTIVRFDSRCDEWSELKVAEKIDNDRDVINWGFKKQIRDSDLKGTLSIDYSVVIWTSHRNNCEKGAGFNCYRFVPKVSFSWEGYNDGQRPLVSTTYSLEHLTAFYRLDYGSVGFALTKDKDNFPSFVVNNLYRQDIQTKEIQFQATRSVGIAGEFDNMHTVHEDQQVIIPGCGRKTWFDGSIIGWAAAAFKVLTEYNAFDCVHMHWRWSESTHPLEVDPMVEPSDDSSLLVGDKSKWPRRGTPNLVDGQTIQIGIVRQDTLIAGTPKDPDDPLAQEYLGKPETIATTHDWGPRGMPPQAGFSPKPEMTLKSLTDENGKPTSSIVWYVAKSIYESDTFFRHGIFVIDPITKKAELQRIRSNLQGLELGGSQIEKTALLTQIDDVLSDSNWSPDGNTLVSQNGEIVFTGLSQAATLLVEARSKSPPREVSLNQVISELLSATQSILNTDLQKKVIDALAFDTGKESEFNELFWENVAIQKSIEGYILSSNEPDVAMAPRVIDGFKQSWIDGVKGISEIATAIGLSPPIASAGNATGTTLAGTPSAGGGSGQDDFLTYDNSEYGFKIKYPASWTKNEIAEGVNFVSASEVFNVWSFKDLSLLENEKKTLDENVKSILDQRMRDQSNFRLVESNDIEFTGLPARKTQFTYTDSKAGPSRVMDIIVIKGNILYELYFAASTEIFAKSLPTAEQMFDSFELVGAGGDDGAGDTPKINTSDETIVDTDPADPPPSSPVQQQGQPQQQQSKPAKADMVDYENPDFRLAMKHPSNWAVQENPDYVVFTSPAENEADTSVESLFVYPVRDIPLGNSEEETLNANIEATKDYREPYSDFQLLSSNNIEFNGKTAGQLEYTYTDTNIGSTKAKEIIAIDGNDRYDILFMANADQYASTLPTAQEIIDSIQITPSQEQEDDGPTTTDQVINTTGDDGDDASGDASGDDGPKINADDETIVDTFDDPAVTDGRQGGEGGEGVDNTQNGADDNTLSSTSLSPSDFKDYSNSGLLLSMKYPSDWTVQENPNQVTFVSPLSGESDQYLESLSIGYEGNLPLLETEQETLDKNVETVTEHRKATLTGFEIQESEDITLLRLPAHKLVYTMDDVNIGPAKATEIILINGNNRYDMLFIANPDQYDSVLPVAEEMINSILLTTEDGASSNSSGSLSNDNNDGDGDDNGDNSSDDGGDGGDADTTDAGTETLVDTPDDLVITEGGEADEE